MAKFPGIFQKIQKFTKKHNLISPGDRIVAAVSGGPDSVFMLHYLLRVRKFMNLSISMVHLHHGIRGEEADEDAAFCKKIAQTYNLPYLEIHQDVPGVARKKKLSIEEAGRLARLSAYRKAIKKFSATAVATGHTADDQAETVLMKIITGTGKVGLSGIHPNYESYVIRPILSITREEIINYLRCESIDFRIDRTNLQSDYLRNRVRKELIPLIKNRFNPNVVESLCRLARVSREELKFLDENTRFYLDHHVKISGNYVRIEIPPLGSLSPYFLKHILRKAMEAAGADLRDINFTHTENLYQLLYKITSSSIELPGGLKAFREYDSLVITRKKIQPPEKPPAVEIKFPGEYVLKELQMVIRGKLSKDVPVNFEGVPYTAYFDADLLSPGKLTLRTRQSGDRFCPLGMSGEKKLNDFFIDEKIPKNERNRVPLLVFNDEIVWVVGIRPSDKFKVRLNTKRVLVVQIEKF